MSVVMNRWLNDTTVLSNLRSDWDDKLVVAKGQLHLEQGQHLRILGTVLTPQPSDIADHLESLIQYTAQECFHALRSSRDDTPIYYEKIADFKKQVKYLCTSIYDLQLTFKSHDCNDESQARRYSQLHDVAYTFLRRVKEYKATLKKPSIEERPVKHIEYNERTDYLKIKWRHSKRVPIEETVSAAKQALSLAQPQGQFVKSIKNIGMIFFLPIAGIFTVLKIVLWNPLEWLILREVRTRSPLSWLIQNFEADQRHMKAYQSYSKQLLHQPFITEKVVEAFKQLAPQANVLDLESALLASQDIIELAPFIKEDERVGAIPVVSYLNRMKRLCAEKNIKLQSLYTVCELYKDLNTKYLKNKELSIDDFFEDVTNRLKKDSDKIPAHETCPYISPKSLQKLLDAASKSSQCRKIRLSNSLTELQFVRDFLSSHSYRLQKKGKYGKMYYRYSLF